MWAIWRLYGIITHMFRQDEYDIPCAIWRLWLPVAALVAILAGCATIPKLDTPNPAEEIRRFYIEEGGDPYPVVRVLELPLWDISQNPLKTDSTASSTDKKGNRRNNRGGRSGQNRGGGGMMPRGGGAPPGGGGVIR